jgi:DNA-binding transcriptional ArsR family regulator
MVDDRPPVELSDPRALRAYAHPVRGMLVGLLRLHGPLTATEAGAMLGESSGTMSFHLRLLARYGLVEEAPRGTGRAKPWQATSLMTSVPSFFDQPETVQAAQALKVSTVTRYFDRLVRWLRSSGAEPREWLESLDFGDALIYVTPDEMQRLSDDITELIESYTRRLGEPGSRPPGSRPVQMLRIAYPVDTVD